MADERKKCAHGSCTCMAAQGSKYCSTLCEDATGVTTLQCDCGHQGCKRQEL